MKVSCSKCKTVFLLDDDLIKQEGIKVRCTVCQSVYLLKLPLKEKDNSNIYEETEYLEDSQEEGEGLFEDFYDEDFDYYSNLEKDIKGKRTYYEFAENSPPHINNSVESELCNNHVVKETGSSSIESLTDQPEVPLCDHGAEINSAFSDDLYVAREYDSYNESEIFSDDTYERQDPFVDDRAGFEDQDLFIGSDKIGAYDNNLSETSDGSAQNNSSPEWYFDDFELDEYDDVITSELFSDVEIDGGVSVRERAYQIAIQTAEMFGWTDDEQIELLATVFSDSGWSLTKTYLTKEVRRGMTFEMFQLAVSIRELWNSYNEFTIGVFKGKIAQAHLNVRWGFCHKLINCYLSLPDIDEIEMYLVQLFDYWNSSDYLKKYFSTFYSYIKFRVRETDIPFEMAPEYPYQMDNYMEISSYFYQKDH